MDVIVEKFIFDDFICVRWILIFVVFKFYYNLLIGNYDVNVLIVVLERRGKNVVWYDWWNGVFFIDFDGFEIGLMGIVLNIFVRRYGGFWKGWYWVILRKIDGVWYNLDSDFKVFILFKDVDDVRVFLDSVIFGGGEILFVMNDK